MTQSTSISIACALLLLLLFLSNSCALTSFERDYGDSELKTLSQLVRALKRAPGNLLSTSNVRLLFDAHLGAHGFVTKRSVAAGDTLIRLDKSLVIRASSIGALCTQAAQSQHFAAFARLQQRRRRLDASKFHRVAGPAIDWPVERELGRRLIADVAELVEVVDAVRSAHLECGALLPYLFEVLDQSIDERWWMANSPRCVVACASDDDGQCDDCELSAALLADAVECELDDALVNVAALDDADGQRRYVATRDIGAGQTLRVRCVHSSPLAWLLHRGIDAPDRRKPEVHLALVITGDDGHFEAKRRWAQAHRDLFAPSRRCQFDVDSDVDALRCTLWLPPSDAELLDFGTVPVDAVPRCAHAFLRLKFLSRSELERDALDLTAMVSPSNEFRAINDTHRSAKHALRRMATPSDFDKTVLRRSSAHVDERERAVLRARIAIKDKLGVALKASADALQHLRFQHLGELPMQHESLFHLDVTPGQWARRAQDWLPYALGQDQPIEVDFVHDQIDIEVAVD
jgi:hypothetical protein